MVAYALISVDSNEASCDFVCHGDNSRKFDNLDGISCDLDDLVVHDDNSSKFGT